jgi:hypothetical protein
VDVGAASLLSSDPEQPATVVLSTNVSAKSFAVRFVNP